LLKANSVTTPRPVIDFRVAPVDDPTHAMMSEGMGKVHVLKKSRTETLCGRDVEEQDLCRGRVVAGELEGHSAACGSCQQMQD